MLSVKFLELIKTIEAGDLSNLEDFFLSYKEMNFLDLNDLEDFNEIRVHAHRDWAISFWQNKADFEIFSRVLRKKIQ